MAQFEVWLKNNRALIRATVGGGDRVHVLWLGTETYSWREGARKGVQWEGLASDERDLIVPSMDYVVRAPGCRSRGKKYNSGTFDGHPFVAYRCHDDSDGTERIYSFATDLHDFPIHATIAYPDRTLVTYDAKSPEVPASFPDSLLELPRDVRFEPIAPAGPRR